MSDKRVYVFDTNIISALRPNQNPALFQRFAREQGQTLCLCEPVIFEVERGYEHRQALSQLTNFRQNVIPSFLVVPVQLADWRVASKLWANARRHGYQLSDVDVLLAAICLRLQAILVTNDNDFEHLALIQTENWLA